MTPAGLGPLLCRTWVRLYTRRVEPSTAEARRAELESDLWEHHQHTRSLGRGAGRYHVEVIARVLLGIGADISWRRHAIRRQASTESKGFEMLTTIRRHSSISVIVLAALGVLPGSALLVLLGSAASWADTGEMIWVLGALALTGVLMGGLILRAREARPRLATALLVIGAPAPSVAFFWFPPLYLLSMAIVAAALLSAPRDPSRIPAPAA